MTFSDEDGQVVGRRHYDAFGKTRMIDGTLMEPGARPRLKNFADYAGISNIGITRRGFTDHLHLDDVELIHMNGRVYDYNLGRFLSVDPVIQSPGNSQSLNPYSYLMNNPLAGTDPTGYIGCGVSQMADSMCPHMIALENVTTDTSSKPRQNDSSNNTVGNGASDKVATAHGRGETSDLAPPAEAEGGQGDTSGKHGSAESSGLTGKIEKSELGKDEGSAQKTFDKAYEFFKDDASNMGEEVEFKDEYAISIRSVSDHNETYAPKLFKSFEEANEYAGESYGAGYEKVWVFGYHYGGKSTIYKPATFSRPGFTGVERAIATLAHESRHYNPANLGKARPHNSRLQQRAFALVSQQAVDRFRRQKGVGKQ
ncbi:RHS repeat domain-containing protein [Pseudidiomarina sp. WS423]|uniref:RHS repeat domain-containing protein n=2 Tax=Idiomarinaceae TaxID=267893 RepID=UPI003D6F1629